MGLRRRSREAAVQAVYMCDFHNTWDSARVEFCLEHFAISKAVRVYAEILCKGVIENLQKIDSKLTCASEHWSISRMGKVDRAILRVMAYEILFCADVPQNVAIDEAVEVAKSFGSDESPNFINGVLDRLAALQRQQEPLRANAS